MGVCGGGGEMTLETGVCVYVYGCVMCRYECMDGHTLDKNLVTTGTCRWPFIHVNRSVYTGRQLRGRK